MEPISQRRFREEEADSALPIAGLSGREDMGATKRSSLFIRDEPVIRRLFNTIHYQLCRESTQPSGPYPLNLMGEETRRVESNHKMTAEKGSERVLVLAREVQVRYVLGTVHRPGGQFLTRSLNLRWPGLGVINGYSHL